MPTKQNTLKQKPKLNANNYKTKNKQFRDSTATAKPHKGVCVGLSITFTIDEREGLDRDPVKNSPLWKRVIAWERSRAASGYGIIWGDADRNKQEEFSAECHSVDWFEENYR